MTQRTRDFLIHVLRDTMNLRIDDATLTDDTPIGSSGLALESMEIVELALHTEQELGVAIPDEDLGRVSRFTVGELIGYLDAGIRNEAPA